MYFSSGYGTHGTYWHNNFGQPMSRGCVNMTIGDAQWLYNWAPVGTLVVVHSSELIERKPASPPGWDPSLYRNDAGFRASRVAPNVQRSLPERDLTNQVFSGILLTTPPP